MRLFFISHFIGWMIGIQASFIHEKVIVCGVCKNVEKQLHMTIGSIEKLGSSFLDYKVFVYENNSQDKTKQKLHEWMMSNPRVMVVTENFTPAELYTLQTVDGVSCVSHVNVIAYARNCVLERVLQPVYDDYKYLIMVDMDSSRPWDIEGILSSFYCSCEWDAILANGINDSLRMYDYFAWRNYQMPVGPERIGDVFWETILKSPLMFERSHPMVPVESAFGGIGVYRREILKGCRYAGIITQEVNELYDSKLSKYPTYQRLFDRYYRKGCPRSSSKYPLMDGQIVCEHVVLHAQMIKKGFDRIFMNPRMIFYQ